MVLYFLPAHLSCVTAYQLVSVFSGVFVSPSSAGPYGRAATEAACDVVRSCALSHECRTVLSQSGFFVDAFAQIR